MLICWENVTVHQLWLKRTIELIINFSNTIIQHQQWASHNQQYCKGWRGRGGGGERAPSILQIFTVFGNQIFIEILLLMDYLLRDYILIPNLMHWLLFIHKILFSSTCFEPQVFIFRRIQLYTCSLWHCQSLWEFLVACRYTAWVRTDCREKVVGRAS